MVTIQGFREKLFHKNRDVTVHSHSLSKLNAQDGQIQFGETNLKVK